MNFIKVRRIGSDEQEDRGLDSEECYERIAYDKQNSGWRVNTENIDGKSGMRNYAHPQTREMDLRTRLRKEYDVRY